MSMTRPPYASEFREQMVELVRSGRSPGELARESPIAGDAELEVNLTTLADDDSEQDLRFRDIFFINRFESDSEDRWFPTRNIDYKLEVSGNEFWNVTDEGHEQDLVTGAFLGTEHEHMGGTVKRTDMIAAFGGSR